jgi:hypothetical protein
MRQRCMFSGTAAIAVALSLSAGAPAFAQAQAEIHLRPGATPALVVHQAKARDYAYCEIALAFARPPQVVFQFYNTTGTATGCPADLDFSGALRRPPSSPVGHLRTSFTIRMSRAVATSRSRVSSRSETSTLAFQAARAPALKPMCP